VEVFSDAGVSGATTARDGLHHLMATARSGRLELVLVDDLSRLSRDLGDLFRIVFDDMLLAGVVLLDCQTGMRSDQAGARMTFGAVGLASDAFLQMVKHETHRGLEGRALAGFHTGGRCYGYKTIPEPQPTDPLHPRAVPVVDLAEATVVRRIFETYAAGASLREIAAALNREGMRAPYDDEGYEKPAGHGWGHPTIRAMLRNERYLGRISWNKRQWIRGGARKRRRSRARPREEWITSDRPELAIISSDLWRRVQERIGERRQLGMPRSRSEYFSSPISGLLRCGACGGRMSIVGQAKKGDAIYRNFGCSANRAKGPEVCPNGLSISEKKALAALSSTIRLSLAHPRFRERFEATFRRLWREAQAEHDASDEGSAIEAEVRATQGKLERLMRPVEDGHGDVESILDRIRALEATVRELRQKRAAAAGRGAREFPSPPDPARLLQMFEDIEGTLATTPAAAREALEARLTPVVLTPHTTAEGTGYRLDTALKMHPAALVESGRKVCFSVGCGGRI
jgi:site-specific DNA recombinase